MIGNLIHLGYRIGYPHDIPQKITYYSFEGGKRMENNNTPSPQSGPQLSALYFVKGLLVAFFEEDPSID